MILCYQPPDLSVTGITNQMKSDNDMVTQYGFLLPPFHSLLRPALGVTAFLALLNFWLGVRKKSTHAA